MSLLQPLLPPSPQARNECTWWSFLMKAMPACSLLPPYFQSLAIPQSHHPLLHPVCKVLASVAKNQLCKLRRRSSVPRWLQSTLCRAQSVTYMISLPSYFKMNWLLYMTQQGHYIWSLALQPTRRRFSCSGNSLQTRQMSPWLLFFSLWRRRIMLNMPSGCTHSTVLQTLPLPVLACCNIPVISRYVCALFCKSTRCMLF